MSEQLNEALQVLDFLAGTGELEGCGFGDKPAGERGNYWWRRHLPKIRYALSTHHAAPGAPQQEASGDAVTQALHWLDSALRCKAFEWDGDQAALARQAHTDATAFLASRAAATAPAGGVTDAQLAKAAHDGYDNYWTEDSKGIDAEAWTASAKAVLALTTAARAAEPEGKVSERNAEWCDGYSKGFDAGRAATAIAAQTEKPEDTKLLDWLQEQGERNDFGWECRISSTGRGWRLHQDPLGPLDDVREAIRSAMLAASPTPPTGTSKEGGEAC